MTYRIEIIILGIDFAKIYTTYKGNFEDLYKWISGFHQEFIKSRGIDPEYEFAQIIRDSVNLNVGCNRWRVLSYEHNKTIDFKFILKTNKEVEVLEYDYENFKFIQKSV